MVCPGWKRSVSLKCAPVRYQTASLAESCAAGCIVPVLCPKRHLRAYGSGYLNLGNLAGRAQLARRCVLFRVSVTTIRGTP